MKRDRFVAVSIVCALTTAACSARPQPTQSPDLSTSTPAPSASAAPASPSGSPSGSITGRIVFDNHEDVWSINANGTDLKQLTDSPGFQFDPSWSPDGTQIVFRSEGSGETEIWLMNADGTNQHRLTAGLAPAWSPDGSLIAFAGPAGESGGITIIHPDGSGLRLLPNTPGGEYPSWSPDGDQICFNSNLSGEHVMYVTQADGSSINELSAAGEGWQVDWSPDGSLILFTSHRDHADNYTDIYSMNPDGSDIRRLTNQRAYTPAWSPDGLHIAFSAPGLFVMNADGSGVTAIPTNVGETSLPDWAP